MCVDDLERSDKLLILHAWGVLRISPGENVVNKLVRGFWMKTNTKSWNRTSARSCSAHTAASTIDLRRLQKLEVILKHTSRISRKRSRTPPKPPDSTRHPRARLVGLRALKTRLGRRRLRRLSERRHPPNRFVASKRVRQVHLGIIYVKVRPNPRRFGQTHQESASDDFIPQRYQRRQSKHQRGGGNCAEEVRRRIIILNNLYIYIALSLVL